MCCITGFIAMVALATAASVADAGENPVLTGKKLGTIFNNDINNIIYALASDTETGPADYRRVIDALLDLQPGVLAQNVGLPDPVIYRSEVATPYPRHLVEISAEVWPGRTDTAQVAYYNRLIEAGTDPLAITVDACRERGVPLVASYRMNAEDWYQHTWRLSDFGRAHPKCRIPGRGCLDPARPEVFEHRMAIFREVVEKYDIAGVEFDFRRWYHMVSNPTENHVVLTRMVRQTRAMLDEVSAKKNKPRMLLGVRVGPSLDSDPSPYLFPGIAYAEKPTNASCRELGLDLRTWVKEGLVDYVCPSLFLATLPGLPLTGEFAELAQGTDVGIYPCLFPKAAWMHEVLGFERPVSLKGDDKALAQYKYDLCTTALQAYRDGADGISSFNWWPHLRNAGVPHPWTEDQCGDGAEAVQTYVYPLLGDPKALSAYLRKPWAVNPGQ